MKKLVLSAVLLFASYSQGYAQYEPDYLQRQDYATQQYQMQQQQEQQAQMQQQMENQQRQQEQMQREMDNQNRGGNPNNPFGFNTYNR